MRLTLNSLSRVVMIVALSAALPLGCSDDDDPGTDNDSGVQPDSAISQVDAGPQATVSGVVESFGLGIQPLKGATVTELDAVPANSATSAADGAFSIDVPLDQPVVLEIAAAGHLPMRLPVVALEGGLSEIPAIMLAPAAINLLLVGLSLPTQDVSKGMLMVDFDGNSDEGGEKAILSLNHDDTVTVDRENRPVKSDTLIPVGSGLLAFPNVEPGTTTITFEATTGSCALAFPDITDYEVLADTITLVRAVCTQ